MLTTEELRDAALKMQSAHDNVRQIEPFTSLHADFDLPSAYRVAEMVHCIRLERGMVPVGRKIGFTNYDMWNLYGVREPVWAYVYDSTVIFADAELATCRIAGFCEPKIEPEVVFHFHTAPPLNASASAILECVDWMALGFEVVQSHFAGWKFRAADTVADCSLHAALIVGHRLEPDAFSHNLSTALEHFSVKLFCNSELREIGTGANVLGSPVNAIAHLMSVLSRQSLFPPLLAGELVSTGTITTAQTIQAGQTWGTEVDGIQLHDLSLTFNP
jgi:2-keto-4-pentenoate hydratase